MPTTHASAPSDAKSPDAMCKGCARGVRLPQELCTNCQAVWSSRDVDMGLNEGGHVDTTPLLGLSGREGLYYHDVKSLHWPEEVTPRMGAVPVPYVPQQQQLGVVSTACRAQRQLEPQHAAAQQVLIVHDATPPNPSWSSRPRGRPGPLPSTASPTASPSSPQGNIPGGTTPRAHNGTTIRDLLAAAAYLERCSQQPPAGQVGHTGVPAQAGHPQLQNAGARLAIAGSTSVHAAQPQGSVASYHAPGAGARDSRPQHS
ncbi:hypothetical protein L226DRAFT_532329 [Lentinus tigrinus ALCF2SS1-7]|nr:hypothetical protein L226DRAFT_532329 [Lentinus tigrinus ALCF2SS1-7]